MNKQLTDDYNFISQFDTVAAEVYKDKKHYYLSLKEIAKYREVPASEVKVLYVRAKELLKNRDQAWLVGLSNRAKLAIIANKKYNNFRSLYDDVMSNNVDLESLPKIGHKVALEIHGWIIKHKAI